MAILGILEKECFQYDMWPMLQDFPNSFTHSATYLTNEDRQLGMLLSML